MDNCTWCGEPIEGEPVMVNESLPCCSEECAEDFKNEANEYDEFDYNLIDGVGFADPGGNSALRAETPDNPRDQPCPTCGAENVLTRIDVQRGYQCNRCADMLERGVP